MSRVILYDAQLSIAIRNESESVRKERLETSWDERAVVR